METSPEDAPPADTTRGLAAALLNNLGSERALAGHPKAALEAYQRSARLARTSNDARALAQGEPSPVPAEQSLQVATILDAIYRSQEAGAEVRLD